MNYLWIFLTLIAFNLFAQKADPFRIDSLPTEGVLLDKGWKWHAGDNPDFAKPDFDDSRWESIDPTKDIHDFPPLFDSQVRWLRLTLHVPQQLPRPLGLSVNQATGSQVYLNGKLIQTIGQVQPVNSLAQDPLDYPLYLPVDSAGTYHLAVRLAVQPHIHYTRLYALTQNNVFCARLVDLVKTQNKMRDFRVYYTGLEVFKIGLLFMLFVLHLAFYLYERSKKTHLLLAAYFFGGLMQYIFKIIGQNSFSVEDRYWYLNLSSWSAIAGGLFALWAFYRLSKTRFDNYFAIVLIVNIVGAVLASVIYGMLWSLLSFGTAIISFFVTLRLTRIGLKNKDKGFIVLGIAVMFSSLGFVFIELLNQNVPIPPYIVDVFFNLSVIAIPVGLSLYMGIEAGERNRELQVRLTENESLKIQAIAQEQEKQQILATQNENLERQVAERTAELEDKNRELVVEAALERVRSRTMAMQHSDELQQAANLLFLQVQELGIPAWSCGYNIFEKDEKECVGWMSSEGILQPSFRIPLTESPTFIRFYESKQHYEEFYVEIIEGAALENHYKYMMSLPGFKEIGENFVKSGFTFPTFQMHHVVNFSHGNLIFITGEPISEHHDILKRFANVFEQTYTRFLDLQKAEEQAREAQIEAALEKVRSASLAIHQSHELEKVVVVLFDKLNELSVPFDSAFIYLFDKPKRNIKAWVASKMLPTPIKVKMPYDESVANNPIIVDLWHAIENSEHGLNKIYTEKDKDDYYRYEAKYNPTLIPESVTDLQLEAESWITSFASEKNSIVGFDSWTGYLTTTEDFQILKRFAKIFEQAYTRFLDLQKAEAQAKESQIQLALERVRARTLAMQKSDELAGTAAVLFQQLIALGIAPNRLYISIIKSTAGDTEFWITDEGGTKVSTAFAANMNDNITFRKMYEGWKQQQRSLVIDMQGEELHNYFNHQSLKGESLKGGHTQKRRVQEIAYFSKGFIGIASPEAQPVEMLQLLERFASVFNLTFTRFNDLQIAEAHAEQARLDLIQIQSEKKRAEDALSELRITQAQLIQKEKLASLGELTAGIAHEIQNPLNFVNNFSEVSKELIEEMEEELDKGDTDEAKAIAQDIKQNLTKINHHGKRASSIVKGMLEHSRTGTGERQLTDINQLVDEYLRLSYHGLRAKDSSFNCDYELITDKNLPKTEAVPQEIGRVLLNLLNNAFYAVHERAKQGEPDYQPKVIVTTDYSPTGGWDGTPHGAIRITDNGTGIPDTIKSKIFQPFFTTKPTGEGTGLGLSLSYDIITKGHGGTLEVESVEKEGTMFIVKLPIQK